MRFSPITSGISAAALVLAASTFFAPLSASAADRQIAVTPKTFTIDETSGAAGTAPEKAPDTEAAEANPPAPPEVKQVPPTEAEPAGDAAEDGEDVETAEATPPKPKKPDAAEDEEDAGQADEDSGYAGSSCH